MERICKFYKEESGNWYIDLPEWEYGKEALQMVYGADTLLDHLAQDKTEVNIRFSTEYFEGSTLMTWIADGLLGDTNYGGGSYYIDDFIENDYVLQLWLCDVTKFVFGEMPKLIYFNNVE